MYIKLMGGEDAADDDSRKTFSLIQQVTEVSFSRGPNYASVRYLLEDGSEHERVLCGNVYILNDQGEYIDAFGEGAIPTQDELDAAVAEEVAADWQSTPGGTGEVSNDFADDDGDNVVTITLQFPPGDVDSPQEFLDYLLSNADRD